MADLLIDPTAPRPADRLADMSPQGRLRAYEDGVLTFAELQAWAALYPDEVPVVNGELPWIVADLE
jgi:hypothetical protein